MKKDRRAILMLGGIVPLGAALFYFLADDQPSSSPGQPSTVESPSTEPSTPFETTAARPETSELPPAPADSVAPSSPFEKPESEELFWKELERLEHEDKEKALAYALAGEDWYGEEGKPAEGRRAKIVTLLVDVGRMDEARAKTRVFIEKYPSSSYRRLVQGVTGIHPRPGAPAHLAQ